MRKEYNWRTGKELVTTKKLLGWLIETNEGIIEFDESGVWWFSTGYGGIGLFENRKEAIVVAHKCRTQRPDLITSTKTRAVYRVSKGKVV